jgi:hypothetical protein
MSVRGFLEAGTAEVGFFQKNRLIQVCDSLDGFPVAGEADRSLFLR